MKLDNFFKPKNIAVVGASRNANKVGHQALKNSLETHKGKVFAINPNADEILGLKCYKSIKTIKEKIDLVLLALPAKIVLKAVKEINKKGVKDIIIYAAGFKEIGNNKLEEQLKNYLKKHKIRALGVNCMGTYDAYSPLDTIFNPSYKMGRPEKKGGISFVCQSGAAGATILDLMEAKGYGISKFISYGNSTVLTETDFLEYLNKDKNTKVICMYIEGIEQGRKFLETAKSCKKPVIVVKGGTTEAGHKATLSHTGSLAGSAEVYFGAFKQANIITAKSLQEMFDIARILEKDIEITGKRVQVLTNGGGYGIMATDTLIKQGLIMTEMEKNSIKQLKKSFPEIVVVKNPIDLTGESRAEWYQVSLESILKDKNVDAVLIVLLYQTPHIDPKVVDLISSSLKESKKPTVVVSVGGHYTETLKRDLEDQGVVCFDSPERAANALAKALQYKG